MMALDFWTLGFVTRPVSVSLFLAAKPDVSLSEIHNGDLRINFNEPSMHFAFSVPEYMWEIFIEVEETAQREKQENFGSKCKEKVGERKKKNKARRKGNI